MKYDKEQINAYMIEMKYVNTQVHVYKIWKKIWQKIKFQFTCSLDIEYIYAHKVFFQFYLIWRKQMKIIFEDFEMI